MTLPTRNAILLFAAATLLFLGAAVDAIFLWAGLLADAGIVALLLLEGKLLRKQTVQVSRAWSRQLQINRPAELIVQLSHHGSRPVRVALIQTWPNAIEGERKPVELTLSPGESVELRLPATPRTRGQVTLPPLQIDTHFRAGLGSIRTLLDDQLQTIVYPDLQRVSEYDKLRRSRSLTQAGFHRQRVVGHGKEFDQMRNYLPGDDFRDVNWKATARLHRPITNLYQAERSRDILICVDHGRMMANPVGQGSTLDRAVDAALMLTHVARAEGDRVGLTLFRDRITTTVKPASDAATSKLILKHLASAQPNALFTNYAALVESLRKRQSHRCLIFIFTNLSDPQLATDLSNLMPALSKRHVVVVVSLRDTLLERVAAGPAADKHAIHDVLAARQLLLERSEHTRKLVNAGVHLLEADADQLDVATINRYLAIKNRQIL